MKNKGKEHTLSGRILPALGLIGVCLMANFYIAIIAPQTPERPLAAIENKPSMDPSAIISLIEKDPARMAVLNLLSIITLAILAFGIFADIRFFRKQYLRRHRYGHILAPGFPNAVAPANALSILALIFSYYTISHIIMLFITVAFDGTPLSIGLGINAVLEMAVILTVFAFLGGAIIRLGRKLFSQIPRLLEIYAGIVPLLTASFLVTTAISSYFGVEPEPMPVIRLMIEDDLPVIAVVLLAIEAVILAPIAEELLFRGVIFGTLRRFGSFGFSALTTAIIFSALHEHIFSFLPIALLGIVFAHYYEKTRNIAYPIMLHAIYNAVSLLMVLAYRFVFAGVN